MSAAAVAPEFGEVFRYNEAYYVYLAQNELFIYTAKILDPDMTLRLKNADDKKARMPSSALKTDGHRAFAYIILTTDKFTSQAAHLGSPAQDTDKILDFDWIGTAINETDKEALKEEILREGSAVEKGLKKIFQSITS